MEKSAQELLKDAQKYRIEGGINGNLATRFEGNIMELPDGKVIGIVRDCREKDIRKLVLGFKHSGFISFWKMAHFEDGICPEIYNCEGFNTGGYVGRYDPYDNLERYYQMTVDIPEIEQALNASDEDVFTLLAGVDLERIEEYLDPILIVDLNIHGKVSAFRLKEE